MMHVKLTVTLMTFYGVMLAVKAVTSVPVSQSRFFDCNGDICNTDEHDEFCSDQYKMCRPCNDVIDDCFTPALPQNCSSTCIKYHFEKKLTEAKEKTCVAPKEVYNGRHNGSFSWMHNVGDVLEFTCNTGYRLIGQCNITCYEYGVWSSIPPTCNEVSCQSLPKLQDGKHNGSLTFLKPGDVVVASCSYGYTLYGENITVCDSNGVWTHPLPMCQKVMCLKPHPIRNLLWPESSSRAYQVGHTLKPTCEENSIMNGSDLWNCSNEGTWISRAGEYMPVCLLKGESAERNTCLPWIVLGIPLIISAVLNGGLVLFVFRLKRQRQQHQGLQQNQSGNGKRYMDSFDTDSEHAKFLNKNGDREMNEDLVSLRIRKYVRDKVVLSGKEVPKYTVNQHNEEQHSRTRFADTGQECDRKGNLILHVHTNNNNNNKSTNNNEMSDTGVKQTKQNNPSTTKHTPIHPPSSYNTTKENDKRPVEETGSVQPQQTDSANENTERKLSFAGISTDLPTAQGDPDLENIENSNARLSVQQTINNEQDLAPKVVLSNGEINTDDVSV